MLLRFHQIIPLLPQGLRMVNFAYGMFFLEFPRASFNLVKWPILRDCDFKSIERRKIYIHSQYVNKLAYGYSIIILSISNQSYICLAHTHLKPAELQRFVSCSLSSKLGKFFSHATKRARYSPKTKPNSCNAINATIQFRCLLAGVCLDTSCVRKPMDTNGTRHSPSLSRVLRGFE